MFNNNKRYTCKSLYRRYIAPQAETLLLQRISACLRCDSGGIQTHDLQNRNLTLYSAKLPSQRQCKSIYNLAGKQMNGQKKITFDILQAS